jgi:hypothetical protein
MVLKDQKEARRVSPEGRKPYSKPKIQVYGDLGSITKTQHRNTKQDSGDGTHTSDNT